MVTELIGKYGTATVYAKMLEKEAVDQIKHMLDHEVSHGSSICIMPDAHAGKGCTIGTTMTLKNKVVPNLVGVDIGCGMYTVALGDAGIDLPKTDRIIHGIPSGFNVWEKPMKNFDLTALRCYEHLVNTDRIKCSIGTLGGGNHFIEIARAPWGTKFLVIHTGSRNLGKQVAEYYQNLAVKRKEDENKRKREYFIRALKAAGEESKIEENLKTLKEEKIDNDLCYLSGKDFNDYLYDMEICQEFARKNRETIAEIITEKADLNYVEAFHTIHNYIDTENLILRKGAVAAYKDQRLIIPLNMRDGSILAVGKGNPRWNYSAPHGAGRLMSRKKAKENLSLEEFEKEMSGIYSTSVKESTLDESPMAYKSMEDILSCVGETVNIVGIIKPIYNFKAS